MILKKYLELYLFYFFGDLNLPKKEINFPVENNQKKKEKKRKEIKSEENMFAVFDMFNC
jgi:hypothetical protein